MAIDNSLLGSYDKESTKVKEGVYRVKNAENDDYIRIHFETNSKMIHDATNLASANKVARRDANGSINFNVINANTLDILGNSALKGNVAVGGNLSVADGRTSVLGGDTTIKGTSSFNGKTTHHLDTEIKGELVVSANASKKGDLTVAGTTNLSGSLSVANGATLRSSLVVSGATTLNSTLAVAKATTISDTLTVNGAATLGKTDGSNTITVPGTLSTNQLIISSTSVIANLNADRVDNCHVLDTQTSTANLWTAKKIDDTKANKTVSIGAGSGLSGGGDISANRTISHGNVTRTDGSQSINTSGTECSVIRALSSNSHGHITGATTVNLDGRYYTKDITDQRIQNAINDTKNNDVILKNPTSGTVNGKTLTMDGFKIQFNSTTQSIDFVFA